MKEIVVTVEIWACSDPDLDEAEVTLVRQFTVGNFKIPLTDIISQLSSESVKKEYPGHEYVGYEVISYS